MTDTTSPIYRDEHGARIVLADSLAYLATLDDNSIDSIVTDPPYEIGFMGRGWDNTGIAYNVELWKQCLRVLKPGGHALVFGATRTYHRVAVALEDAGFEIRDSINWLYGSGFPKSLNVSKAIEAQITTGSSSPTGQRKAAMGDGYAATPLAGTAGYGITGNFSGHNTGNPGLDPTTPEAQQWSGWGTALKPAHEPIVVARKPLQGTVANNVLTWGTGGLNIDGSRVGTDTISVHNAPAGTLAGGDAGRGSDTSSYREHTGRFPANILLTHSVDCEQVGLAPDTFGGGSRGTSGFAAGYENDGFIGQTVISTLYACIPGCPVAALDDQTGTLSAGHWADVKVTGYGKGIGEGTMEYRGAGRKADDAGGASRFFSSLDHDALDAADPFFYSGKAPTRERPIHPETGKGHPTVKPLSVMRWLISLVTPPQGLVLDPFAGSGATVEAALLDGFRVIGVDITPEHMPLIDARIDRWAAGLSPTAKPKVKKRPTGALTALDAASLAMGARKASQALQGPTGAAQTPLFDVEEPNE